MTEADTARRNILLLAVSQALYSCCVITVFTTASLVGLMIAPEPGLATLPITTFVVGAALVTIPASLLMQRFGRIPIFMAGALTSAFGAGLAVLAIYTRNFPLFCVSTLLQGVFQSTSGYYRFAAVEGAAPAMKAKAISWVLTGGVVAAVVGTLIASGTSDLFAPFTFLGSFAAVIVIAAIAIIVLSFLRLPKPTKEEAAGPQRPWAELLRQPRLIVAISSAVLAYGLMNFMMTAAPVAMVGCGFTKTDASWVIQWHVLAMFLPSFITGNLITKYGAEKITALGFILLVAAGLVGLSGIAFGQFAISLILLGLGWNFGFIGGTTMLTSCYAPSERGKVQGANDFLISLVMVFASFSSGKILALSGWWAVAVGVMPFAIVALALIGWLALKATRHQPAE
jgi:MFS family permease